MNAEVDTAEEEGVQMETNSRCASRSGAGGPAFDLCKLGCMVRIGMTNVNEWNHSICMSRTTHARRVTILTQEPYSSAVHLHFTR